MWKDSIRKCVEERYKERNKKKTKKVEFHENEEKTWMKGKKNGRKALKNYLKVRNINVKKNLMGVAKL